MIKCIEIGPLINEIHTFNFIPNQNSVQAELFELCLRPNCTGIIQISAKLRSA